MSQSITVAAPPDTATTAAALLAYMAGQSGVVTDYNEGSQIRTVSEAIGQVTELQGVAAEALAFQTIIYGCWAAFGIQPLGASAAEGNVTFTTAASGTVNPPGASQSVAIQLGTYIQTAGGTIYQTSQAATLVAGATGISVPVVATTSGSVGNSPASTLTTILTSLPYPLFVTNVAPLQGGADAETPDQTMTRFTARVQALGTGTPVAGANACVGAAGLPGETVRYANCDEPWLRQAVGQQAAGFTVYLDNGSGTASVALIASVTALLNGSYAQSKNGNRPAGVPYAVAAVSPVFWSLTVTATLLDITMAATAAALVQTAAAAYQASLLFGAPIEFAQVNAGVANALAGYTSALTVVLLDNTGTAQQAIAVPTYQRAQLTLVTPSFQ